MRVSQVALDMIETALMGIIEYGAKHETIDSGTLKVTAVKLDYGFGIWIKGDITEL